MCGIMAAEYRAMSVSAVDRCITNRHLVIQGDAGYVTEDAGSNRGEKEEIFLFMQGDEGIFFFFGEAYIYTYIIYVIIYIYTLNKQGLGRKAIRGEIWYVCHFFATKMSNNWNWDKLYICGDMNNMKLSMLRIGCGLAPLWTRRSEGSRQEKNQTFQRGVSKRITPLEIELCHWTTAVNWHFAANMAGMKMKICAHSI